MNGDEASLKIKWSFKVSPLALYLKQHKSMFFQRRYMAGELSHRNGTCINASMGIQKNVLLEQMAAFLSLILRFSPWTRKLS